MLLRINTRKINIRLLLSLNRHKFQEKTRREYSKTINFLSTFIKAEIKYQEKIYTQPHAVTDYLAKHKYIEYSEQEHSECFYSNKGRVTIEINDRHISEEEEEKEEEKDKKKKKEIMDTDCSYDFKLIITKNNLKCGLMIDAYTDSIEGISVNNITYHEDIYSLYEQSKIKEDKSVYYGPGKERIYEMLGEMGVDRFLEALKLNEEMALFINKAAYDKEKRLLIKWLKTTHDWLQNKDLLV